jgi:hypothetical protein
VRDQDDRLRVQAVRQDLGQRERLGHVQCGFRALERQDVVAVEEHEPADLRREGGEISVRPAP